MTSSPKRFLVLIFLAPRELLQDSAVLTDIQNRFWTPTLTLPQNWWRELETEPPPWATLNSYLLPCATGDIGNTLIRQDG